MKRCTVLILFLLMLALPVSAAAAEPGPFAPVRSYTEPFPDVPEGAWYAASVAFAYEYRLVDGCGDGLFQPGNNISVAELLTLSARLNAIYTGLGAENKVFRQKAGETWYTPYVAYLRERALLPEGLEDPGATATRGQMAAIFAASLPGAWYDDRNAALVDEAMKAGFIPDVTEDTPYREQILWMYRQGLLEGMDAAGSFTPAKSVTRAEIAALLTRIVEPSRRMTPAWTIPAYRSAAGMTLASIVPAPTEVPLSPDSGDTAAIDACVRQMLAGGTNRISLTYPSFSPAEAGALVQAFVDRAKTYCEQMYNQARISYTRSGRVTLTLGSTACTDSELEQYREETMQRAIAVHDALWADGTIRADMTEYEIAERWFVWLCENCTYDREVSSVGDMSHLAYGALINGTAVCDGYTGAYNLLLKLEGIECRGLFNKEHIWTVAVLDGTEYHIDTTWGDQSTYIASTYFGMTEEQSREHHAW